MKRYWNYKLRSCYIERQLPNLPEEVRNGCVEIDADYWRKLVKLSNEEGYLIMVDTVTGYPYPVKGPQSEDISEESNS